MDIVNFLIEQVLSIFDTFLPVLNVPEEFYTQLDIALSFMITMINKGAYFLPIDIMLLCFSVLLLKDNFVLLMRIGQKVISWIRG